MRLKFYLLLVLILLGTNIFSQPDSSAFEKLFYRVSGAYAEVYKKDTKQDFFLLLNTAGQSFLNADNPYFIEAKNDFKKRFALNDNIAAAKMMVDSFFNAFLSPQLFTLLKGDAFYKFHEPAFGPFNEAFCACLQKNNPAGKLLRAEEREKNLNSCIAAASNDMSVRIKMRAHVTREGLSTQQLLDMSNHSSEYSYVNCGVLKKENVEILTNEVVGRYRQSFFDKRYGLMDSIIVKIGQKKYDNVLLLMDHKSTADLSKINSALTKNKNLKYSFDEKLAGQQIIIKRTAYLENKNSITLLFQIQFDFAKAESDDPQIKKLICLPAEKIKNKKEIIDGMIKEVDELEVSEKNN